MWKSHERQGWGVSKRAAWRKSRCTVFCYREGVCCIWGPCTSGRLCPRLLNICNEQHYSTSCHHRWGCGSWLYIDTISPHHNHWNSSCSCGKWLLDIRWSAQSKSESVLHIHSLCMNTLRFICFRSCIFVRNGGKTCNLYVLILWHSALW